MNQIFKISHVQNVNKSNNRLTPVKLESKKQESIDLAGGFGREVSIERQEEATSHLLLENLPMCVNHFIHDLMIIFSANIQSFFNLLTQLETSMWRFMF